MLLYVATAALVLLPIILNFALYKQKKHIFAMFPTIPSYTILGNALLFVGDAHKAYKTAMELYDKFRRSFCLYIGPIPFIMAYTPEETEAILNNTTHIRKSKAYDGLIPWIGQGLLTSTGERWKKSRKLLTPAFHFKILDGFIDIFNKNSDILCSDLKKKDDGQSFNVVEMVKMSALDNICETAMGVSVNAQKNPTSDYVQSVHTLCLMTFLRTVRPWLRPNIIFKFTSYGRAQKRALHCIHSFSRNVIESRIEQRRQQRDEPVENDESLGIKKKRVFMDILIDHYEAGLLTVEEVQEEVDTFMFEGHDTITAAISFAIHSISLYPQIQDRLYKEQYAIFADSLRDVTTDDITQMKYLEMVIKEVLRHYPSVPVIGRTVEAPLKLDDKTIIPPGADAVVFLMGLHMNPKVWKNPEIFDPERFSPENSLKRHPYAYIPFSAGPRNCIGMKFAFMEMKTTLSKIIRQFKLLPGTGNELKLAVQVILQSHSGVSISLQERTRLSV